MNTDEGAAPPRHATASRAGVKGGHDATLFREIMVGPLPAARDERGASMSLVLE